MQIDEKTFVVDSLPALVAFRAITDNLIGEFKHVTFTWRIGQDRSLDQNALFHVWATIYAAHFLKKDRKQVSKGELEGMKRILKKHYHLEFGYDWLVHEVVNPENPAQKKMDYTSSADWKVPEMFAFMCWLQMRAAHDGLVLESTGQFGKLQREQIAA